MNDLISRQAAIDAIYETFCYAYCDNCEKEMNEDLCGDCHRKYQNWAASKNIISKTINSLPSAQPEQRYTEEELRVFAHGISLRLLSKRSAQHWRYDKETATEIEFLERLYEKVGADIRGKQE